MKRTAAWLLAFGVAATTALLLPLEEVLLATSPTDGPRPAAASSAADGLEAAVSRMSRVGFSRSPSFSPDGETIAFVSNLSGLPQVWTIPAMGGFPTMVTASDDPVGGVEWSPDGPKLPGDLASGLAWSKDGAKLAMSVSGATAPANIFIRTACPNRIRSNVALVRWFARWLGVDRPPGETVRRWR